MNELQLPICSFAFSLLLIIVYFSKKRLNLLENHIYALMLICGLADSLIVSLERIIVVDGVLEHVSTLEAFILQITNKLDFGILIGFVTGLFLYTLLITFNISKEKFDKILKVVVGIDLITYLLICILNINLICDRGIISVNGSAVFPTYILCGIYLLLSVLITIFQFRKITKRHIPILSVIGLLIALLFIYQKNPYIMVNSIVITFVNYLMYFTIENPDLKMLNELELAKNNAERANEAKTDFLSNMSHEIRTPLNAIVGFSNSILEDTSLEEAKTEAKDIIMASNNLLEIVNGILDISKIEAGKMEMVEVEYSPRSVFEDITKLILPRLEEKPIELKTDFSSDLPAVLYGDMGKVREIITNLLTNAVKYTNKGMIVFQVSCINQKGISKLVISVEDTGRGIKPEKIDKLFTKFQRLEEDRNTTLEGTGLGLAITKSLVEMMGGKIVVQSKYGSGSKFTVYLKQKIVKMVSDKVEVQDEENTELVDYSDKKILVVDDNMLNIKVATRLLKNYKIVPDTVLSGEEALKKVKEEQYDLIFMDDMMPKLSGGETFQKMQEDKNFKVPVVVLTANAISGMREKYLSVGFTDYLAKPIDKLELERILKENLDNRRSL